MFRQQTLHALPQHRHEIESKHQNIIEGCKRMRSDLLLRRSLIVGRLCRPHRPRASTHSLFAHIPRSVRTHTAYHRFSSLWWWMVRSIMSAQANQDRANERGGCILYNAQGRIASEHAHLHGLAHAKRSNEPPKECALVRRYLQAAFPGELVTFSFISVLPTRLQHHTYLIADVCSRHARCTGDSLTPTSTT